MKSFAVLRLQPTTAMDSSISAIAILLIGKKFMRNATSDLVHTWYSKTHWRETRRRRKVNHRNFQSIVPIRIFFIHDTCTQRNHYFTDMILTGPSKPEGSSFEFAW
jgi:hypothetical protein